MDRYDRECIEMVGRKYGKLTVEEYLGLVSAPTQTGSVRTTRKVRVRCECGQEMVVDATVVKCGYLTTCKACKPKPRWSRQPSKLLCWTCRKCTNKYLCPWAGGKPRKDWDAEKDVYKVGDKETETYIIRACPGYEEGRR